MFKFGGPIHARAADGVYSNMMGTTGNLQIIPALSRIIDTVNGASGSAN
jgi:hypothetical protein